MFDLQCNFFGLSILFALQAVLANGDIVKTGNRARKSSAGSVLVLQVFVVFNVVLPWVHFYWSSWSIMQFMVCHLVLNYEFLSSIDVVHNFTFPLFSCASSLIVRFFLNYFF